MTLDAADVHERIENLARGIMGIGRSREEAYFMAVLTDIVAAPERSPLILCEHDPKIGGRDLVTVDATLRIMSCVPCFEARTRNPDPDTERLLNLDKWCDLCGADTGRPPEVGGGTSGHVRTHGKYLLTIWTCIDCEGYVSPPEVLAAAGFAKTPRNAPCPCGSGRKYKHCHGGHTSTDQED